ncbi:hypothetical protein FACS1894151_06990 [Spirochaetia bacterium]|nr:hypothetical protein FACS1894151_06990 [Spirochaetia bacterium]
MNNIPYQHEKSNSQNATVFKDIFSPFVGKYIAKKQNPELFDDGLCSDWFTIDQPLTDPHIESAIAGTALIGYFLSISARSFCVDIDDHTGKGPGYLLSVYQNVVGKLECYPSLVCKTPRGLHAFYFLEHHVPEILLIAKAKQALQGVPVEVRPTKKTAVRIPAEPDMIDPHNFTKITVRFKDAVNAALVYHPFNLFGAGILPQEIVESLKDRRDKAVKASTWKSLSLAVNEYAEFGIQNGATNIALNELVPMYRSAGLTPEETAAEFAGLFSSDYIGELRNPRRLLQRIQSYYKTIPETQFNTLPKQLEVDLFTEQMADAIAALVTGPTRTERQRGALTKKRRTVKKAVIFIERWCAYIGVIVSRKELLEMWNYLYPYFKKNTSEGLIPVSRNLWQKIYHDYGRWLMPFLKKIGYIERSNYRYSKLYGICYYYRVNGYQFIKDMPKKPVVPSKVRHAKAKSRAEQIRAYKREHPNMSNRAIAKALGISHFTVNKTVR